MDGYSGKRPVNSRLVVSRKGPGLVLRETPSNGDNNPQYCSRIGCSGRLNSSKAASTGTPKPLKPSARLSCGGREMNGSSSKPCTSVSSPRKTTAAPRRKLSSRLESDSSETSSVQDEPEIPVLIPQKGKAQRGLVNGSESSSVASGTRSRRNLNTRSGLGNRATSVGPSSSSSTSTRSSTKANADANSNPTRYSLRRCSSISDIVPSNCSSSTVNNTRSETVRNRNSEGESSSSARGKKINGSTTTPGQNPSSSGLSISDSRRASRYTPPNRDNGVSSGRPRRPISGNSQTRTRVSNQVTGNNSSSNAHPPRSYPELSIDTSSSGSSRSHLSSTNSSLGRRPGRSGSRSGSSSSENILGSLGFGSASRSLGSRDSLRQYNIDEITEVLLALERIENEGISFEHLFSAESNVFLNGMNLFDQHRGMRLDIDNMSYEELLALEERMGDVSTALTEEDLSECLKRSIFYHSTTTWEDEEEEEEAEFEFSCQDDVKCSVCQEEYEDGDEVGRLKCEHRYHTDCIQQWLRLKNWCPICKSSASAATSSLPLSTT